MASFTSVADQVVTDHEIEVYGHYDGTTHTVKITVIAKSATGDIMSSNIFTDTGSVPDDYLSGTDRTNIETILSNQHTKAGTDAT